MASGLRLLALSASTWLTVVVVTAVRECGMDNNSARAQVIGGYPVAQNGFPWVVSIRLRSSGAHICAGTLISDQFVLTAGHCMYKSAGAKRKPTDFFIVVGAHRLNLRGLEESWLFAREIHIHPNYRSPLYRKWSHDLAIIELRGEHPYEKTGRPACLPTSEAPFTNEHCLVLGWGQTETARYSNVLKVAVAPIIDTDVCNVAQYWDRYVDDTMMCAGIVRNFVQEGSGSCQGDSGGPLLCQKGAYNQWALYGIVSWGPVFCGEKPGVFTNLVEFGDWIRATIRKNGGHLYEVQEGSFKSEAVPRKLTHQLSRTHFGANSSTPTPPCDGTHFQRSPGTSLTFGPTIQILRGISVKECLRQCCLKGRSDCRSFVYDVPEKRCGMMKVTRCDSVKKGAGVRVSINSILFERLPTC